MKLNKLPFRKLGIKEEIKRQLFRSLWKRSRAYKVNSKKMNIYTHVHAHKHTKVAKGKQRMKEESVHLLACSVIFMSLFFLHCNYKTLKILKLQLLQNTFIEA